MNTAQVTACQPWISGKNVCPCVLPMSISPCSRVLMSLGETPSFGLNIRPKLKSRKPLRVCSAGGKGMAGNGDENSPWKSITKAMEKFKGGGNLSVEELLQQQIQKGEYFDSGGGGGKTPGGGDGGGSGGGDNPGGAGGPEDMSDDTLQVILATTALLTLYVYLISGKELLKLFNDYIKYKFGGEQSIRLKTAMEKWRRFYKGMKPKKEVDEYWLEKTILNTPTWWYNPKDFRRAVRNYYASTSDPDSYE